MAAQTMLRSNNGPDHTGILRCRLRLSQRGGPKAARPPHSSGRRRGCWYPRGNRASGDQGCSRRLLGLKGKSVVTNMQPALEMLANFGHPMGFGEVGVAVRDHVGQGQLLDVCVMGDATNIRSRGMAA